jgi:hypothetical protein
VLQDAPYRATVLEPIGKFAAHLPEVNNAISKRQKKVRPSQGHGLRSEASASFPHADRGLTFLGDVRRTASRLRCRPLEGS